MTKRIFKSICVVAVFVFIASVVLIMGVLHNYFSSVQKTQLIEQLELAQGGVEADGISFLEKLNPDGYRITLIGGDGSVLFDSESETEKMENHIDREEVREAIEDGRGESSRQSTTMMERQFYEAVRMDDGTVLRISAPQQTLFRLLLGMMQPLIIVLGITLLLALYLAYRLTKRIIDPLNDMDISGETDSEYEEIQPLIDRIKIQKNQIEMQRNNLEKAETVRREFTANVAHELKTPLQTISGSAELMYDGIVKEDDIRNFARNIYRESKRLISLVDDITGLSKLDAGQYDHTIEEIDMYEQAEQVVEQLRTAAERSGVSLSLSGKHVYIHGIRRLIESIFYNLTDNAIKYSKEGGYVKLDISEADGKAVLTVSDNGIGIPEDEQERIFERFYRVDKSRSKEVGGTGLGLSIVKHAAMVNNAEIKVDSKPGEGTSISVIFSE